jgi:hypothetical protein
MTTNRSDERPPTGISFAAGPIDFLTCYEQSPEKTALAVERLLLDEQQYSHRATLLAALDSVAASPVGEHHVAAYEHELRTIRECGVIDSILEERVEAQRMAQILGSPELLAAAREALLAFLESDTTTELHPASGQTIVPELIVLAQFVRRCLRPPEDGTSTLTDFTNLLNDDFTYRESCRSPFTPTSLVESPDRLYHVQQAFFDGFLHLISEIGLEFPGDRPEERWQTEIFKLLVSRQAVDEYRQRERWLIELRARCRDQALTPTDRILLELFPELTETDLNGAHQALSYRLFMRERLREFLRCQTWLGKDFDLGSAIEKLTRERLGELLSVTLEASKIQEVVNTPEFSSPALAAVAAD